MNKHSSQNSKIYTHKLSGMANSISQIIRIISLQIKILEEMGFSAENLDKLLQNLTPEQRESFNKIKTDVSSHEHSKAYKKLNPSIIKTFNNKNLIQV